MIDQRANIVVFYGIGEGAGPNCLFETAQVLGEGIKNSGMAFDGKPVGSDSDFRQLKASAF